jgi:hypothetical protein
VLHSADVLQSSAHMSAARVFALTLSSDVVSSE